MLTNEQAKENLKKYGPNELEEGKKKRLSNIFRTVQGFSCNYSDHLRGDLRISWRCGECDCNFCSYYDECDSGTVQTVKAEQSLNSLKQLSAPDAKVVRDGQLMQVPAKEVTVGDEVIVEAEI
ncbi:MAG: cation-transporting P-type ATPase [Streptococcus sp.]